MQPDGFFEFENIQFYPQQRRVLRLIDNVDSFLMPKQSAVLTMLVNRPGEIITYQEMKEEVWAGTAAGVDVDRNIKEVMHTLRKALGKAAAEKIETATGKGYRLNSLVASSARTESSADQREIVAEPERTDLKELSGGGATADTQMPTTIATRYFGSHRWYVVGSCALYALLYPVALLLEVAYQFDRYRLAAIKLCVPVFLWVFCTSVLSMAIACTWASRGKPAGLWLSSLTFGISGLILYFAVGLFLPGYPVTQAKFQTYTAHAAFLKDTLYFLPLAVLFLAIPYHFIIAAQKEVQAGRSRRVIELLKGEDGGSVPEGAIYLKVPWLILVLSAFALLSLALTANLFQNLNPSSYLNLFMQLAEWRILIYFTAAVASIIWYYRMINKMKQEDHSPSP